MTYYLLVSLWVTSPVKHTHSHTCWSSSSRGNCNSSPPEINTSSLPESFSSVYVEKLRKITLAHPTTQRNVPRDSEKPRQWWTLVTWSASSLPATNHWRPFFHTHKFLISRWYNLAQPPPPPPSGVVFPPNSPPHDAAAVYLFIFPNLLAATSTSFGLVAVAVIGRGKLLLLLVWPWPSPSEAVSCNLPYAGNETTPITRADLGERLRCCRFCAGEGRRNFENFVGSILFCVFLILQKKIDLFFEISIFIFYILLSLFIFLYRNFSKLNN